MSQPKDIFDLLQECSDILEARAAQYSGDKQGERNMDKTVAVFNALTGNSLSVSDGFKFMQALKMVRIASNPDHRDSYIDLANYVLLEAEQALLKE